MLKQLGNSVFFLCTCLVLSHCAKPQDFTLQRFGFQFTRLPNSTIEYNPTYVNARKDYCDAPTKDSEKAFKIYTQEANDEQRSLAKDLSIQVDGKAETGKQYVLQVDSNAGGLTDGDLEISLSGTFGYRGGGFDENYRPLPVETAYDFVKADVTFLSLGYENGDTVSVQINIELKNGQKLSGVLSAILEIKVGECYTLF